MHWEQVEQWEQQDHDETANPWTGSVRGRLMQMDEVRSKLELNDESAYTALLLWRRLMHTSRDHRMAYERARGACRVSLLSTCGESADPEDTTTI